MPDTIRWNSVDSGEYSTSSAYKLQFPQANSNNYKSIFWKAWALGKTKFFYGCFVKTISGAMTDCSMAAGKMDTSATSA